MSTDQTQLRLQDVGRETDPITSRSAEEWRDILDACDNDFSRAGELVGADADAVRERLSAVGIHDWRTRQDWQALYDRHDGVVADVAEAIGASEETARKFLCEEYRIRGGRDRAEWQAIYDRHDGVITDIAEAIDGRDSAVRTHLTELGIHEKGENEPYNLIDSLPHEYGLGELNCGICGKPDIREHPCPACGFDPAQAVEDAICDQCGMYEGDTEQWGEMFCEECYETGETRWESPATGVEYRVTKWAFRDDGGIRPMEREPVEETRMAALGGRLVVTPGLSLSEVLRDEIDRHRRGERGPVKIPASHDGVVF